MQSNNTENKSRNSFKIITNLCRGNKKKAECVLLLSSAFFIFLPQNSTSKVIEDEIEVIKMKTQTGLQKILFYLFKNEFWIKSDPREEAAESNHAGGRGEESRNYSNKGNKFINQPTDNKQTSNNKHGPIPTTSCSSTQKVNT